MLTKSELNIIVRFASEEQHKCWSKKRSLLWQLTTRFKVLLSTDGAWFARGDRMIPFAMKVKYT